MTPYDDKDYFFHTSDAKICPFIKHGEENIKKSLGYNQTLLKYRKDLFPILAQLTNAKWGTKYTADTMDFADLSSINDLVVSLKFHNFSNLGPEFDEKTMFDMSEAKKY